jgi:antitoxin component YwqK of YwqJK toxin-antitoxin module
MKAYVFSLIVLVSSAAMADCEKNFNEKQELEGVVRCFDGDGKVRSQSTYLAGKLHGELKEWDATTGNLIKSGTYVGGEPNGVIKYFYADGSLEREENYQAGKKDGIERSVAPSGATRTLTVWKDDALIRRSEYFENGHVRSSEENKDGVVTFRRYYDRGQLKVEGRHPEEQPERYLGELRSYEPLGQLVKLETFAGGIKDGVTQTWDHDGHPKTREVYAQGQLTSLTEYDRDGRVLRSEEYYADGSRRGGESTAKGKQGRYRETDDAKHLTLDANYENGVLDGVLKTFFPNGKTAQTATYKAGLKEGPEETFYPHGALRSRAIYRKDLLDGPFESFTPDGEPLCKLHFSGQKLSAKEGSEFLVPEGAGEGKGESGEGLMGRCLR